MFKIRLRRLSDDALVPVSIASLTMGIRGDISVAQADTAETSSQNGNDVIGHGPALVVRCLDRQDVLQCVDFAARHGLVIAMHNRQDQPAAWSGCEQGIAVDLGALASQARGAPGA